MTKQHLIQVYYYPRAVRAKKYHKPSDLKQQKLKKTNKQTEITVSQFRKLKVKMKV